MKKIILILLLILGVSNNYSQNITNTLGASGLFSVKDGSTTFLSLNQANGYLNLTSGVIFKGADRFIHSYQAPGTVGDNVFIGVNSGNFSLSGTGLGGSRNTAVGKSSLFSLTSGIGNSAFGNESLNNNTTGGSNSAFGSFSLTSNGTGHQNSAFGFYSLLSNTTGSENSAFGANSLKSNTSGFQNTAIGHHSLEFNTGNYNTALGYNAGSTITTGANLTCIGIDANPTSATAADQITLGNIYVSSLRCNVQTITSLSDKRDKKNIKDLSLGLDLITKLKPRQFNWDKRDWYEGNMSDGSKMQETPTAGFIAQEFDEVQNSEHVEWLNLVLKDNPEKWEATPGNLFPIVVKAIQELKNEKDNEIARLTEENEKLKIKLERFEETQLLLVKKLEEIESNSQKTTNLYTQAIKGN